MKIFKTLVALLICVSINSQTTYTVNTGSYYYTPSSLTVNVGDSVKWINDVGTHDVNGDLNSITGQLFNNPVIFGSPITSTVGAVIFAYKFTVPGTYNYDCSVGAHAQAGMVGSIIVNPTLVTDLNLTAIFDLTINANMASVTNGSQGKAILLTANQNIADLSTYGLGSATNGGGSDGEEFTFPSISINSGQHVLLCRDSTAMSNYFDGCLEQFPGAIYPTIFIENTSEPSGNGNDAYELFHNNAVIETFGEINHSYGTSGFTSLSWAYRDSWAWKDTAITNVGNWVYGGDNCSDSSITTQTSDCPFPLCGSTTSSIINNITDNILIYPNPTSNYIYLSGINGDSKSKVYDITGKLLQSTSSKKIDLLSYPNGLYILYVHADKSITTHRIIKD